jgi:putative membrane protein
MRFILIVLLVLVFAYSLALVLLNDIQAKVNLVLTQVPEMNLGLLLIITLVLGVVIGLLLGLQIFRVFQMRWEISRLHKELEQVRARHVQAATAAAAAASAKALHPTDASPPSA